MLRTRPDLELDRRIAALALPALGAIAAEPAYNLADTAIVGHLGRTPLGALAIASTALTTTAWLAIFLSTATTSAVAGLAAARAPVARAARRGLPAWRRVCGSWSPCSWRDGAPGSPQLLGARQDVLVGRGRLPAGVRRGIPFLYLSSPGTAT